MVSVCIMSLKCVISDDGIMHYCQICKCLLCEQFHSEEWGDLGLMKYMWHSPISEFKWGETSAIVYGRINGKFGHGEAINPIALIVCYNPTENLRDPSDGMLPH